VYPLAPRPELRFTFAHFPMPLHHVHFIGCRQTYGPDLDRDIAAQLFAKVRIQFVQGQASLRPGKKFDGSTWAECNPKER
jgi:hypothetical protein